MRAVLDSFATAVVIGGSPAFSAAQWGSAAKSIKVGQDVAIDECGTTPEHTKIYSTEMMSYVTSSFATRLGRAPSVYEQFAAM